jgi:hypothetical protein
MVQRFGGTGLISLLVGAVLVGILWQYGVGGSHSSEAAQAPQQITQAENVTGEINLTALTPAIQAFFADHGTYEGLGDPTQGLMHYDASATGITVVTATPTAYCIQTTSGTQTTGTQIYSLRGPGGAPAPGPC